MPRSSFESFSLSLQWKDFQFFASNRRRWAAARQPLGDQSVVFWVKLNFCESTAIKTIFPCSQVCFFFEYAIIADNKFGQNRKKKKERWMLNYDHFQTWSWSEGKRICRRRRREGGGAALRFVKIPLAKNGGKRGEAGGKSQEKVQVTLFFFLETNSGWTQGDARQFTKCQALVSHFSKSGNLERGPPAHDSFLTRCTS